MDRSVGQEKYTTEVVLRRFRGQLVMLDPRGGGISSDNQQNYTPPVDTGIADAVGNDLDDEIPF